MLSNSRYHSTFEDFYGVVFRRSADSFIKAGNGEWDEVLTPHLEAALRDSAKKKLIVLHTYGSHFEVEKRYPEHAAFFENAYDNSLRYSSDLLAQWIGKIDINAEAGQTTMLIYSSDHGVAMPPCSDQYRTGSGLSSLQVPFLVWANAATQKAQPELLPNFSENEKAHVARSNAELANLAVVAVGAPGSLKNSQSRALSFNGVDWNALQQRDQCSLQ